MEAEFWRQRWTSNQIGFHEGVVNPLLVAHFAALALPPDARVLLPLCGKTVDIDWLLARGHRVVGNELSPLAVAQLFERLGLEPAVQNVGALERWSAASLDVFVGDFFALTTVGDVDAVYDRAAMIALPLAMRQRYVAQMDELAPESPQLLITLDYEQACMAGPPFAVGDAEIHAVHARRAPRLLASESVPGGLKGRCAARENVWLLQGLPDEAM